MSAVHEGLGANVRETIQDANRGLAALTRAGAGLDIRTAELVKTRISQINGCAYCVDLHVTKAVNDAGDDPRRLATLAVWAESPFFTARERAALALAEDMTVPPMGPLDPGVVSEARRHFEGDELNALVATIVGINAWNRVMIAEGVEPPPLQG